MDDVTIATHTEEGVGSQNEPSQTTEPISKETDQPETSVEPQGRGAEPDKSSKAETRSPKPSSFYLDRKKSREKIDNLERTMSEMAKRLESMNKKPDSVSERQPLKFDTDKFFANPQEILKEILDRERELIKEETRKEFLERDLPEIFQSQSMQSEMTRRQQDAMEMIFPKSGIDDKRSLQERVEDDPDRMKRLDKIWDETGMIHLWNNDPVKAASNFIKLAGISEPKKNPNVINKKLMGSTATGTAVTGGKKMATLEEIKTQLDALQEQVNNDPDLRYDDNWVNKRKELVNLMSSTIKEARKDQ